MGGRQIWILCEGKTEENAINYFIKKQWENDGLKSVGLSAKSTGF